MVIRRKKHDVNAERMVAMQRIRRAIDYLNVTRGLDFIRLELDGDAVPKTGRILIYNRKTGGRLADFHRPGAGGNWTALPQLAAWVERMAYDWGMPDEQDTQVTDS